MEGLELVPDHLLGLAGNLPAQALPSGPKPIELAPVLVRREVDGIFAISAALGFKRQQATVIPLAPRSHPVTNSCILECL
jgi:hypothetical protein